MRGLWVKIFGERNTGTNALSQLVSLNSESQCLPGTEREVDLQAWRAAHRWWIVGDRMRERRFDRIFAGEGPRRSWKHCATNFEDVTAFEGVLILLTVRHPASWLVSLFRNPYQSIRPISDTLAQFLDFNWKTHRRERLGCRSFKPLDLYRAKMASYFAFADRLSALRIPHSFVRFEDIVLEQESVFSAIAGNLREPRAKFEPLQVSTKEDGLFQRAAQAGGRTNDELSKDLSYYRQYYGEERWRGSIAGLESEINARVDWVGLAGFGYEPL